MALKVWTAPEVHLLASNRPRAGWEALFPSTWLEQAGEGSAADRLCEATGRVCYDSYSTPRPGGTRAYLARIKEQGHGEVLEHSVWTFLVRGISRSCSQQLTRYRTFSFCQRSSRFCDEGEIGFVRPPALREGSPQAQEWEAACDRALEAYRWLSEQDLGSRKETREAARSVLPQCASTEVCFTANARALRHALEQRCHAGADREIRVLFNALYSLLRQEASALFDDYTPTVLPDGSFTLSTPYRKV